MRLKTKLVIAIAGLVLLISGLVSLVYVTQLLDAAVKQTYESDRMIANELRFALQKALEAGLKGVTVDPNNPAQLRDLEAQAIHNSETLRAMISSVNLYSLSVYDVNIADAQSRIILSTNPENNDKTLPVRTDYKELLNADPIKLYREVFGFPKVFDVIVPLERNGAPFATVHVGARTTLLREAYAPWLRETLTLTGFAIGTALLAALLLSNLALRPMEEIAQQLDYWAAAGGAAPEEADAAAPKRDTPERVSTKIEQIGQRMRN